MYITGSHTVISLVPPGEIYYDDDASRSDAIDAEKVNRAYEQYRKAKERLQELLLSHNPQDPMPAATKTAAEQEAFALWVYQDAIKTR